MLLPTTTTKFSAVFKDAAGTAFDPGGVLLVLEAPDGTRTEYVYGEDIQIIRVTTGSFRADINLDAAGTWIWRWEALGTLKAAHEGKLVVRETMLQGV